MTICRAVLPRRRCRRCTGSPPVRHAARSVRRRSMDRPPLRDGSQRDGRQWRDHLHPVDERRRSSPAPRRRSRRSPCPATAPSPTPVPAWSALRPRRPARRRRRYRRRRARPAAARHPVARPLAAPRRPGPSCPTGDRARCAARVGCSPRHGNRPRPSGRGTPARRRRRTPRSAPAGRSGSPWPTSRARRSTPVTRPALPWPTRPPARPEREHRRTAAAARSAHRAVRGRSTARPGRCRTVDHSPTTQPRPAARASSRSSRYFSTEPIVVSAEAASRTRQARARAAPAPSR